MATGENSLIRRILDVGYDGALLDRVDAYGDWRSERASAEDDMIDLVGTIRRIASETDPQFLLGRRTRRIFSCRGATGVSSTA